MAEETRQEVPKRAPQVSLAECNRRFLDQKRGQNIPGRPVGEPMAPAEAQAAIQAANAKAEEIIANSAVYASEHAEARIAELTLDAAREMVANADTEETDEDD